MLVFINVLFGLASTENIDNFGHLGGFVTGLPFSMALMPIMQTSMRRHIIPGWTYEKKWKAAGAVLCFLWITIGVIMFYVKRDPTRQ
mmetsp:Transcript_29455/g.33739  ORF Transcript_29455/g.33739 Transcript_29455/m.33739 type:complete len:87 (+) Transcript_29455:718-978(+)